MHTEFRRGTLQQQQIKTTTQPTEKRTVCVNNCNGRETMDRHVHHPLIDTKQDAHWPRKICHLHHDHTHLLGHHDDVVATVIPFGHFHVQLGFLCAEHFHLKDKGTGNTSVKTRKANSEHIGIYTSFQHAFKWNAHFCTTTKLHVSLTSPKPKY